MKENDNNLKLSGLVPLDDAYLAGRSRGGKRCRGAGSPPMIGNLQHLKNVKW